MPRAHHRLNIYAVPIEDDWVPPDPRGSPAWRAMVDAGMLMESGASGPRGDLLIPGGFSRVRIDKPRGRTVYSNRTGGFAVACGGCGEGLGRDLSRAVTDWREGGESVVRCSGCHACWAFHELGTDPAIAMGSFALEWRDVGGPVLSDLGRLRVGELLGGEYRLVLSRG